MVLLVLVVVFLIIFTLFTYFVCCSKDDEESKTCDNRKIYREFSHRDAQSTSPTASTNVNQYHTSLGFGDAEGVTNANPPYPSYPIHPQPHQSGYVEGSSGAHSSIGFVTNVTSSGVYPHQHNRNAPYPSNPSPYPLTNTAPYPSNPSPYPPTNTAPYPVTNAPPHPSANAAPYPATTSYPVRADVHPNISAPPSAPKAESSDPPSYYEATGQAKQPPYPIY